MVCDSAFRCDRDQQASLLGNVILCGGGACITGAAGVGSAGQSGGGAVVPGTDGAVAGVMASMLGDEHAFPDRLREEIEAIVHRHTPGWRVKVTSPNVSERAICSWLGGSILGVWCCNCESKVPIVIGVGRSFFEPRVSYAPECL